MTKQELIDLLKEYICQYSQNTEGEGLALIDVLSPIKDNTIERGKLEIELLVDHIYCCLDGRVIDCEQITIDKTNAKIENYMPDMKVRLKDASEKLSQIEQEDYVFCNLTEREMIFDLHEMVVFLNSELTNLRGYVLSQEEQRKSK